jgi:hypothetical protein
VPPFSLNDPFGLGHGWPGECSIQVFAAKAPHPANGAGKGEARDLAFACPAQERAGFDSQVLRGFGGVQPGRPAHGAFHDASSRLTNSFQSGLVDPVTISLRQSRRNLLIHLISAGLASSRQPISADRPP